MTKLCDENSVCHFLNRPKTDKSCGSDDMPPILMKNGADLIALPLCYIFNLPFKSSFYPLQRKIVDVSPVPKSCSAKNKKLRPISSKMFEKVVVNRYRESLLMSIDHSQFANRSESSTVFALTTVQDAVVKFLDDVSVCAIRLVTFDMTRAFDCIPHHLLLNCIVQSNFPHCLNFVNWLNSYLSDRYQRVKFGNVRSSDVLVTSGVPQASILGPLLFALYFSSYNPSSCKVRAVKYADDITLVIPIYN